MRDAAVRLVAAGGAATDTSLDGLLFDAHREQTNVDANAWIKRLRSVPFDAVPMRARFRYRGDSLWWFTELYLHKVRVLEQAVRTALALEAARDRFAPAAIEIASGDPVVRVVARAFRDAWGVPTTTTGAATEGRNTGWRSYLIGLTARLSRMRPQAAPRPATRPAVAAFVHSAFLAAPPAGQLDVPGERYVGPVLEALRAELGPGGVACVGVGPRRNFRARRWWDPLVGTGAPVAVTPVERLAPASALRESRALWHRRADLARELTTGDAIREAARYRGLDLWDVLRPALEEAALLQWPWSARAMDEAGAALDRLAPDAVVTYAEAGGWGRALILEARRRRVPSVGLQHGFIYRHWLNYQHEPDEIAPGQGDAGDSGFPLPTRTLVFDECAAEHLRAVGHFPAAAVEVTGSPQLDAFARRFAALTAEERRRTREAAASAGGTLLVLVAKGSEIAAELPALRRALEARPDVRLAVKPHPAETPAAYGALSGLPTVRILAPDADLAALLAVADGLVTRNSTVAIDALALDVPAIVVGLPNNLSPFVEAGAMLGATGPDGIGRAIGTLLYDAEARQRLAQAARAFAARAGMRPDGGAAERAARAILALRPTSTS